LLAKKWLGCPFLFDDTVNTFGILERDYLSNGVQADRSYDFMILRVIIDFLWLLFLLKNLNGTRKYKYVDIFKT